MQKAWSLDNRLFYAAIILSGLPALIYQLIWVRLLGLVFAVEGRDVRSMG